MSSFIKTNLLFKIAIALLIATQLFNLYLKESTNPIDFQDFIQRTQSFGYKVEELLVETKDGFILSVHRVNSKEPQNEFSQIQKKPILMGHGLGGSSDTFIRNSEERSLAYVLANQGFDVFIMNSRGNRYSYRHKHFSQDQDEYWDFSFAEMAEFDLPAVASFIFNEIYHGKVLLNYIGHSQGSTIVLASLSGGYVPQEYFENVLLITPAAIQQSVNAAAQNLLKKVNVLEMLKGMGMKQFFMFNKMNYYACKLVPKICEMTLSLVTDTNSSPIDYSNFYKLMLHYPSGTSLKAYIHFGQNIRSQKFQRFDYGEEINLQKYNSTLPPEYELSNIHNTINIIAGLEDMATPLSDIQTLKNALTNSKNTTISTYEEGHCSFILGTNNKYQEEIISLLSQSSSPSSSSYVQ